MSLIAELKRRNVFRVAMVYAVAGWVLLQVGELLFGALGVPAWGIKLLLGLLLLGFPLAVIFAWVYELTPEGLKLEREIARDASITHETAGKLNTLIVALLLVAIGLLIVDRLAGRNLTVGPAPAAPGGSTTAARSPPPASNPASERAVASIAVLPFVNMSDDKANEYFSDGLTEELLNVLANVPGLRVIARTSSFSYKGKEVKIADVARDLDVDHVLEGSVRKSGNRVRITAQLIRSSDSSHLWSQTYDRDLNDIFAVQDEISNEVVEALKVKLLTSAGATPVDVGGTQVAAAYEAYLRGRQLQREGAAESTLHEAVAAYDEAIRLDPNYARAYAGKAIALQWLTSNGFVPFDSGFDETRRTAQHALELSSNLADALLPIAYVQFTVDMNPAAATESMERALRLSPGNFDVQTNYSLLAAAMGWRERAVASARKAVELDPVAPLAYGNLAGALNWAGDLGESERAARRAIELGPRYPGVHSALALTLLMQNRLDAALAELDLESITWQRMVGRAVTFARMGKADMATAELKSMQKKFGDTSSYQYAEIYAALGNRDEAFRWLAHARQVHDPGLMYSVFADPLLAPLRPDPRYGALVRELGFTAGN